MLNFKDNCLIIWLLLLFVFNLVNGNAFYPISYPDRILLEESSIVVGARNSIVRLNTELNQVTNEENKWTKITKVVYVQDQIMGIYVMINFSNKAIDLMSPDLTPDETGYNQCLRSGWPADDCNNDVCIMLPPTSQQLVPGSSKQQNTTILTCTTNAYSPVCTYRDLRTFKSIYSFDGDKFISSEKNYQSAHLFTSDGDLFTYRQEGLGEDYVISKHKQPLSSNSYVRTRNYFQTSLWLNEAEVVSMYEEGDFVYTFFREKAIEVTTRISQNEEVYSRVARICKNDLGSGFPEDHFLSFQKARISCVYQQTSQTPAYHYNEIQDTFKLSGSYDLSSSSFEQVYAVFSSPVNGPVGSAVCVYTFDESNFDLVKAFRGKYINELSPYTWGFSSEKGDINCQANPIRTTEEAKRNVLMQFSVEQAHQSDPLFLLNNQKFVKIVVDRVRTIEGEYNEVMFILAISYQPTIDILLHRVTYSPWRNTKSKLISTNTVIGDTSDIYVTEMKLFKNAQNQSEDGVLIGTKFGIHKLPLHFCSNYKSAEECVESMDPYCVFSCKQQQCISIYNLNYSGDYFLYNYTNGFVWNCPIQFIPRIDTFPDNNTNSVNSTLTTITTATTTTTATLIDPTREVFPLLIPLPPIHIEYLIISVLSSALLFCIIGIVITLCCIKLSLYVRKRKTMDYIRTETDTFGSEESSPTPKQFWEPTATITPYEIPMNSYNYNKYKPSHLQSSPAINASNYASYAINPQRNWMLGSPIVPGSLVKNKFVSSTIPRSNSLITQGLPPLPPRANSNGFLLHSLNPPSRPSSVSAYHQQQLCNQFKRGFPENRTFTPDFLSLADRGSRSEI